LGGFITNVYWIDAAENDESVKLQLMGDTNIQREELKMDIRYRIRTCAIIFVCAFLLGAVNTGLFAQSPSRTQVIEPTGLNAIIDFINNEITTLGAATVSDTKYILRRDATYPYSTMIEGPYSFWVEAEEGEGARPKIIPINVGDEAPRMLRGQDADSLGFTYIGLDYIGWDTDGNHIDNAMLRATGNYCRLRSEDCVYNGHRAEVVRMDGMHQTARLLNNIFRNCYQHDKWNKGRSMVSLRMHPQDTVIISGNTHFNTTTMFNHGATDTVQYFEVSGNTFYNVAARGQTSAYINPSAFTGAFRFGAAQTLIIEDNIFYNVGFMGLQEGWADSFFVFQYIPTTSAATPVFRNNNIYLDPELYAANPDTAEMVQNFDPELAALLGDISLSGNISEALTFTNAPGIDSCKRAIERYWAAPDTSHLVILKLDDTIETGDVDFSYDGALSGVGGTDGQPLGAPRWHAGVTVSIEDETFAGVPASFKLLGNYPNPFNPSTTIRFDLHKTAIVQVQVYDILGQLVMETPEITMTAASGKEFRIDAAADWASGVYIYKLMAKTRTSTFSSVGRMLLLK